MKCSPDSISAAAEDRLGEEQLASLQSHLSHCEPCRRQLDEATADASWWNDAARYLDESVLADPQGDAADSSTCDARLFDDDDPIMQLRSMGAIQPGNQADILGQLGRYAIEREIGAGGMGVVVKAHDSELNRMVAIKVLAPHLARSGAAKQRFVREGRAAAAVVHENVVAIHEVDTTAALPYLVMRYIDGISLQRHVDLYGPLSVFDALRIASQAATGLAAAHRQGIIHRDVKPANILVNHSCSRTWISDFGLARAVDDASLTRTGFIAGTPHYMSPEQARGGDVGPRSDLFSLGAVIYFMFTGRPPWRAERSLAVLHRIVSQPHRPLWKLNAQIPRRVSDLVDRLLSKNVSDRPDSAADVQAELERVLSEMQNPESYPAQRSTSLPAAAPNGWWASPWIVAPLAAFLTAVVCLNLNAIQSNVMQGLASASVSQFGSEMQSPDTASIDEPPQANSDFSGIMLPQVPADSATPRLSLQGGTLPASDWQPSPVDATSENVFAPATQGTTQGEALVQSDSYVPTNQYSSTASAEPVSTQQPEANQRLDGYTRPYGTQPSLPVRPLDPIADEIRAVEALLQQAEQFMQGNQPKQSQNKLTY
ncbi:serine/threonine-protein kinase [Rhodopirellula sp. MGV]|uniref:serine/threonine-protein kinase n=1 Tax=Rhodopirellula sp. MGV TaxID=2023130 RepID=UPI000B97063D|nr:serine/threonine-protein kinase [Rhodopirellula sp. MGV]OYP32205.1 hypothetical protein CGZ80_20345 [Rhodopirellula sp. MGV]PNY35556.1 serine/threonine protein kinase [Rhodopirellula baltica]